MAGLKTPERGTEEGIRLADLAAQLGGEVEGDGETRILAAANLEDASAVTIVRVEHQRYLGAAQASAAGALLVPHDLPGITLPAIRVAAVRPAFFRCLELFSRETPPTPGVHPTAVIEAEVQLDPECHIGALAVIGRGSRVARGAVVHAHAVVGEECEIGPESVVFPHVTLYPRTVLGARVRIHSGTVIGADGYGYEWDGTRHAKKPHNGRVRVGDDVEIGANATIDRATTGETVIGPGTKIDNLAHVAHNVRTGAHCLIVAQVGIAGSATLGNGVVIGGQAGVNPHISLGDGARVAGQTGVWSTLKPGVAVSGNPARPHREELRIQASLSKLPELMRHLRSLEQRLAALEGTTFDKDAED
jgi:UDP-3-O-[3-hydroxymyristoyl] glucosamine N-acyltransferase